MPIVVEKPTYPAVSLEEAKKHLDVVGFNDDDEQIASLILAATEYLEKALGICLRKTKFQQNSSSFFGPHKILIYPVINIDRIELVLEDGSKTTLASDSYELFTTHGLVTALRRSGVELITMEAVILVFLVPAFSTQTKPICI